MANENNYKHELVSDEDAAAPELELLTSPRADSLSALESELAADTCSLENGNDPSGASLAELQAELSARSETISNLEYGIEQLRARWQGLETELTVREDIATRQNSELAELRDKLAREKKRLRKRDRTIKKLNTEMRQREKDLDATLAQHAQEIRDLQRDKKSLEEQLAADEIGKYRQQVETQAGRIAGLEATIRELSDTHGRTESYADTLRRQLEERMETADNAIRSRSELQATLDFTITNLRELQARNDTLSVEHADMAQRLEQTEKAHEEEIRVIRFELGEAQDTATQKEQLNEQLVSDLIDTRNSRLQLESELAEAGAEIRGQVKALEADNSRLRVEISELTEQLESKAETINGLLAELATKTEQIQSIGEIEHVIQEIDERMSDQVHGQARTDRERVMRVLVGSIDGQELRFPLFKPKLTIGRTEQNDIQLRAPYISRRHAVIVTEGDITRVIDWGSKNGVYVNADRISERFLQSGDIVGIGKARFRYEERPMRDA